jgi:uncharacterized protein YjbI with pentapeptide repeats
MDKTKEQTVSRRIYCDTVQPLEVVAQDLSGWQILESTIEGLKLLDAQFNYCHAQDSQLKSLVFDHCLCAQGHYRQCQFEHLKADSSFFTAGRFSQCRFSETVGELSTFGLSGFENCDLLDSRLSEVACIGTTWQDCRFQGENYNFVRFPNSVFTRVKFVNCYFRKVIFRKAIFINCCFDTCQIPETVFHNARFIDTEFKDTDIQQAANLDGAEGLDL